MAGGWQRGTPTPSAAWQRLKHLSGPAQMAFQVRVKAMHYWIRRGNADQAARSARDAASIAMVVLRRMEGTTEHGR